MLNQKSYLLGWGKTEIKVHRDLTVVELVLEAVERALNDANMSHNEINYILTSSVDLWDGKTASNIAITEVVGAIMKGETRVAADGLVAAMHADFAIRSGLYTNVLVVAHCKESEICDEASLTQWTFDPLYLQPLGFDQQAAHLLEKSFVLSKTLNENFEKKPIDGAVALILTADQKRIKYKKKISILSSSTLTDAHYPGRRDYKNGIFTQLIRDLLKRMNSEDLSAIHKVALCQGFDERYKNWCKNLGFSGEFLPEVDAPFMVKGLLQLIESAQAAIQSSKVEPNYILVHGRSGVAHQSESALVLEVLHGT